ncbi:hypothetical protein ACFLUN_00850 [Chloroflexota bacterium]
MKRLAIVQIILGALIISSLVAFVIWIEPSFYHVEFFNEEGIRTGGVFFNPGRNIRMRAFETVYLVLGLSVLGCGIAQFVKSKRSQ